MKIVVDAMGGDHAPEAIVAGAVEAVKGFQVTVVLVGLQDKIEAELQKYQYDQKLVEIIHAPEVVGMDEPATVSIRKKKDSSISEGLRLLKDPQYNAFISAGNTGAVVAAATIYLGMLEGVDRPAIGTVLPTLKNVAFLMDAGANTEAKPVHLLHSAQMASVYAQEVLGIENPTVGLLNIGEEAGKGGTSTKETYKLLQEHVSNFTGNIEANEVYSGKCDCIICDGFVGNIVLKVSEGLMENTGKLIKREVKKNPLALLGALILKLNLRQAKKLVDYSEYGGAPLLGVNGIVMIGHGRSSPKAIKNAIRATIREVEHKIIDRMITEVKK
ncbi:MAG: phosphate acyltransferase PlsX [Candidatus Omnitrophica bacterium]|nr:phosphate acyltransferase PlsX [Candidatus Omnitrophota bacterium]